MAIILGGVELSAHMIWADEMVLNAHVAQTVKRTLGGSLVVISQQLSKGIPITLTAVVDQGWLTKAQVQAVKVLAEQAGSVLSLTIGAADYSVMFRHEDSPAFIATALDQVGAQAPDGYYTATIKLMTV